MELEIIVGINYAGKIRTTIKKLFRNKNSGRIFRELSEENIPHNKGINYVILKIRRLQSKKHLEEEQYRKSQHMRKIKELMRT